MDTIYTTHLPGKAAIGTTAVHLPHPAHDRVENRRKPSTNGWLQEFTMWTVDVNLNLSEISKQPRLLHLDLVEV